MWWKIYFWFIAVASLLGIILVYGGLTRWETADIIEIVLGIITVIGLYCYVYNKQIFSDQFWKIIFFLTVFSMSIEILYKFTSFTFLSEYIESNTVITGQEVIFGLVLYLPVFYALYQLGFKTKKIKPKR